MQLVIGNFIGNRLTNNRITSCIPRGAENCGPYS